MYFHDYKVAVPLAQVDSPRMSAIYFFFVPLGENVASIRQAANQAKLSSLTYLSKGLLV